MRCTVGNRATESQMIVVDHGAVIGRDSYRACERKRKNKHSEFATTTNAPLDKQTKFAKKWPGSKNYPTGAVQHSAPFYCVSCRHTCPAALPGREYSSWVKIQRRRSRAQRLRGRSCSTEASSSRGPGAGEKGKEQKGARATLQKLKIPRCRVPTARLYSALLGSGRATPPPSVPPPKLPTSARRPACPFRSLHLRPPSPQPIASLRFAALRRRQTCGVMTIEPWEDPGICKEGGGGWEARQSGGQRQGVP